MIRRKIAIATVIMDFKMHGTIECDDSEFNETRLDVEDILSLR